MTIRSDDFERGREAAMTADQYGFSAQTIADTLAQESDSFKAGWDSYMEPKENDH